MHDRVFSIVLLTTIVGEFLVPFVLKFFYKGYNWKKMPMSVLGSPQSPVKLIYRTWLIWLGIFLIFCAFRYYGDAVSASPALAAIEFVQISVFAIGAGILSGLFSVNEDKKCETLSSRIHGAGAAIGFILLAFFPLINGLYEIKLGDTAFGIVKIAAFGNCLTWFSFFVLSDKERFRNTTKNNEGLWQRLTLFFMYFPFLMDAVSGL